MVSTRESWKEEKVCERSGEEERCVCVCVCVFGSECVVISEEDKSENKKESEKRERVK